MRRSLALILMAATVSACSNDGLQQITSNSRGPDEFMVDPKRELVIPENMAQLPAPTPGQGNRADISAEGTMTASLGGRPGDANAPVPGADAALVTAASRYGVEPDIRQSLAEEDAAFRRGQSRFTQFKLFPENLYNDVYSSQALDQRETANAWRRAGAGTPTYPPPE